ncbi:hypothetical protein LOK49_LG05G01478 [Camellia lanceoleosa]|uniref:Uncharacterized protein n=1 Tax=Camellia lanceoleosa TaxID=1840588 RepID=A0ACC0HT08_9ERIC|nr:hypothetical protein LOK49_LG05G01478 [Camellia lanceoleosa]
MGGSVKLRRDSAMDNDYDCCSKALFGCVLIFMSITTGAIYPEFHGFFLLSPVSLVQFSALKGRFLSSGEQRLGLFKLSRSSLLHTVTQVSQIEGELDFTADLSQRQATQVTLRRGPTTTDSAPPPAPPLPAEI